MSKGAEFGIIATDEHRLSVWPTHRGLPSGWHFVGPTGTQAEMQEELARQRFAETIPVTYITPDKWSRASQWADTEGGAG